MEEEKKMPEKLQVEEKVIEMLKTVYDPEIPVNVYDLGLIYKIDLATTMP
jgi:Predicted metal-sulfur cluster biosynthetic enzyme